MDKGWGLTLDTSSSQSLSLLPSKQPSTSLTKLTGDTMFPLLGFPVNLSRPAAKDDEHNRKVLGEVDFFSDRLTKPTSPPSHDHHVKPNIVKKEIVETPLHVNVINLPKLLFLSFFLSFLFFPRIIYYFLLLNHYFSLSRLVYNSLLLTPGVTNPPSMTGFHRMQKISEPKPLRYIYFYFIHKSY